MLRRIDSAVDFSFIHDLCAPLYAYDDNKNVVSVASLSTRKSGMEYDDADNLKSYRQPGADTSVKYTMDYGSTAAERKKHLLLTSTTPTGQRDAYTYDTYGNQLTATRQKSGGTAFIQTETAYTANGNYVASTKDARGNTVTQNVDSNDGTLTSVTDPNGQTVNYTYDASKRVTAVQTTANGKAYKNAYTYENDRIKTVAHNTTTDTEDVTYTFGYDALGRKTTVKVGTQTLSTNVYESNRNGLLSAVNYGNGGKVGYAYDDYDRLKGVKYDGETTDRYAYEYGANGQACVVRDNNLNRVLQTEHDMADRPMGTQLRDTSGNLLYRTELDYDKQNRLVGFGESAGNQNYKTGYTYDNDNRVTAMTFDGTAAVSYAYDELGRISTRTVGKLTSTYAYVAGSHGTNSTTPLVASITQGSIPFIYAYDNRGNIISETRNGVVTTYSYDALGQLIRVNDPVQNQTWVFNYDRGGNIVSRVRYAYTTGTVGTALETIPYTYGDSNWKDKLTAYNGKTITYDAIGNPLNDGVWSYEWQAGRQLKRMSAEGTALTFKYDHNGLRTQKVVEQSWYPETTNYYLHGKLLTHMTVDYTDFDEVAHQDKLHFFYDAQSRPAQVNFNGVIYTYVHNLQGDIVGLLDSTGALVVEYKYDAWGKPIATTGNLADTLGKRNPFRYRGYVYDEETGLYYLRSRYYNPTVGRFVNADSKGGCLAALMSHGVFTYCSNVPTMLADPNGQAASWVARINSWASNVIKTIFLNAVDFIAQREYARRDGTLVSFNVSKKYISRQDEKTNNDTISSIVKGVKTLLSLSVTVGAGKSISKVTEKISSHFSPSTVEIGSFVGGVALGELEDSISDFFVDAFSIKQGSYTSICATFQYTHKHFVFFACDYDYAKYEIRNYDNTYYEAWFSTTGCYSNISKAEKIAELDIMD